MKTMASLASSLVNKYIFAEDIKEVKNKFIIENGKLVGSINMPPICRKDIYMS